MKASTEILSYIEGRINSLVEQREKLIITKSKTEQGCSSYNVICSTIDMSNHQIGMLLELKEYINS